MIPVNRNRNRNFEKAFRFRLNRNRNLKNSFRFRSNRNRILLYFRFPAGKSGSGRTLSPCHQLSPRVHPTQFGTKIFDLKFLNQIFSLNKNFSIKSFFDSTFNWSKLIYTFFNRKFFFIENSFWPTNFFTNNFLYQQFFIPTIFYDQKFFFDQNFFLTKHFFTKNFFDPTFFSTQI